MNMTEIFGSMVFNDAVMKKRLPKDIYRAIQNTIRMGKRLELDVANVIASAMKDWAIEHGATHFSHWFQPMTGITAEKHDSFLAPSGDGGAITKFSGKNLVKGESDASSFPSGGLRATFEARGYTSWDPTSYAFIKDKTLYIPTAFCSLGGEALDNKTPLLRSMQAIQKQALRILRLFGNTDASGIKTSAGVEQEYFLIDKKLFDMRPDLVFSGRTLFGAPAPKGQELDDHYFGSLKSRVKDFMEDLDTELWKVGIFATTEHNEAAPAQHELAPIFTTTNIAADQNQLIMELMQKIARNHGMVCLLHEKPFAGVNGSGKHNNWSIDTDTGLNLLNPGKTPFENAQFLLFLSAVIKAVDKHQDLLRISVASAGNDHRLGGNEAPPAIVSIYLGDELMDILEAIENDTSYDTKEKEMLRVGVHVLPKFAKDTTDRNRTSPFAFTGNKFEFRMIGSAASVSEANVVLNTAVADELRKYADILEKSTNFSDDIHALVKDAIRKHKRILFSGNGYDDAWTQEAEKRGLLNLRTTPEALSHYLDQKNIELFTTNKVFSEAEMRSRYEIMVDHYCKVVSIEALTMIDMTRSSILPAATSYRRHLADTILSIKNADPDADVFYESAQLKELSSLTTQIFANVQVLEAVMVKSKKEKDLTAKIDIFKTDVLPAMEVLRKVVDKTERLTAKEFWPYPSYADLLFSVK